MRRNLIQTFGIAVIACATFGLSSAASASVISINIATNGVTGPSNTVGAGVAGVVPVGNWNDEIVSDDNAGSTSTAIVSPPLKDDGGATTSATVSIPSYKYFTAAPVAPLSTGDIHLLSGHVYRDSGGLVSLTFADIPYAKFDLYVYYNSGGVTNSQTITVLDGVLPVTSAVVYETPGNDNAFVESTASNIDANYVVFSGLTALPDFILTFQGTGGSNQFGYVNGIQIVAVPEPATLGLLALTGLAAVRRRR